MPLEAIVDGEKISPEATAGCGWLSAYRLRNASKAQATAKTPQHVGQHGPAVGAKPPSPIKRLATASKLPNQPKDHFRVVICPGGGLDVRLSSQDKVFNTLTIATRLPPSATEEDIVCSNLVQNTFVVSAPQETNSHAYCTVQEIILTEQRHQVATYLTPPGHSCRGVIRGIDIDFMDADLQRMRRTQRNPTVLGARRIKNTTMVVILFNGLKTGPHVFCTQVCAVWRRARNGRPDLLEPLSSTLPRAALSATSSTSQQEPFVTGAHCKLPAFRIHPVYTYKGSSTTRPCHTGKLTYPNTANSIWVNNVAGTGETRATVCSGSLPQPVADKIHALERENTFLRQEVSDIKALLKTPEPQELSYVGGECDSEETVITAERFF
ncbi:hypothetical protein HPB51_022224 [Rhipicephalus microplus]|uniref:Uncharacterized protein n=1 Tax=Rhipicephalus microplus TaxID=6941 RepID=A0A9J6E4S5_RHIMP|nr:hypothetical protein HPB51_022224 [Rhipicephalus microplus]